MIVGAQFKSIESLAWQQCCWWQRYVGDAIMVTVLRFWWQKFQWRLFWDVDVRHQHRCCWQQLAACIVLQCWVKLRFQSIVPLQCPVISHNLRRLQFLSDWLLAALLSLAYWYSVSFSSSLHPWFEHTSLNQTKWIVVFQLFCMI